MLRTLECVRNTVLHTHTHTHTLTHVLKIYTCYSCLLWVVDAAVSAPPVIHPRPPVSETATPVKSTPAPPPPTATSGPQGDS